jgi:hypothetical protein
MDMDYSVETLINQIHELRGVVQALQSSNQPAPVQYVVTDPVVMPERFSGSKSSYPLGSFKLAVERVFELSPGRFPTDKAKVTFIGNLLDGPARRWLDTVQQTKTDDSFRVINNLDYFWESMSRHFGLKDSRLQGEIKLIKFKQLTLSVSDFGIRFKQMASTVDFNDRALVALFISNLNESALNFLRKQSVIPEKLDELIQLCCRVDDDFLDPKTKHFRNSPIHTGNQMDVSVISEQRVICNYCRLEGHLKKFCPKLLKKGDKKNDDHPKASATRQH